MQTHKVYLVNYSADSPASEAAFVKAGQAIKGLVENRGASKSDLPNRLSQKCVYEYSTDHISLHPGSYIEDGDPLILHRCEQDQIDKFGRSLWTIRTCSADYDELINVALQILNMFNQDMYYTDRLVATESLSTIGEESF